MPLCTLLRSTDNRLCQCPHPTTRQTSGCATIHTPPLSRRQVVPLDELYHCSHSRSSDDKRQTVPLFTFPNSTEVEDSVFPLFTFLLSTGRRQSSSTVPTRQMINDRLCHCSYYSVRQVESRVVLQFALVRSILRCSAELCYYSHSSARQTTDYVNVHIPPSDR